MPANPFDSPLSSPSTGSTKSVNPFDSPRHSCNGGGQSSHLRQGDIPSGEEVMAESTKLARNGAGPAMAPPNAFGPQLSEGLQCTVVNVDRQGTAPAPPPSADLHLPATSHPAEVTSADTAADFEEIPLEPPHPQNPPPAASSKPPDVPGGARERAGVGAFGAFGSFGAFSSSPNMAPPGAALLPPKPPGSGQLARGRSSPSIEGRGEAPAGVRVGSLSPENMGGRGEALALVRVGSHSPGNGSKGGSEDGKQVAVKEEGKGHLRRTSSFGSCRICQQFTNEPSIELGCDCKGGLQMAHPTCAAAWFNTRHSNVCEICNQPATNVDIPASPPHPGLPGNTMAIEPGSWGRQQQASAAANTQRVSAQPIFAACILLIASIILVGVISVFLGFAALPAVLLIGSGIATAMLLAACFRVNAARRVRAAQQQAASTTQPPVSMPAPLAATQTTLPV